MRFMQAAQKRGTREMATILPFKPMVRPDRSALPKGGAAIIIFPGVRYERHDTSDDGKGEAARRERRRRRKR